MTEDKKIVMILEKTDTGFSAYCEHLPIFTTSPTIPKLIDNSVKAANLYFEEQGIEFSSDDIIMEVDFKQFFLHYKVLNSKFLAARIDMNPTLLSQYVQGRKKPSAKQTEKILMGIHQIGKELAEISLIYDR